MHNIFCRTIIGGGSRLLSVADRRCTVSVICCNNCIIISLFSVMAYSAFYYFTKVIIYSSIYMLSFIFSAEYNRFHSDTTLLQLQLSNVVGILAVNRYDGILRRIRIRVSHICGCKNRLRKMIANIDETIKTVEFLVLILSFNSTNIIVFLINFSFYYYFVRNISCVSVMNDT